MNKTVIVPKDANSQMQIQFIKIEKNVCPLELDKGLYLEFSVLSVGSSEQLPIKNFQGLSMGV